jgi:hypothetical protein
VFVLTPDKIIEKYEDDMDYTDFGNGETRKQYQDKRNLLWAKKID